MIPGSIHIFWFSPVYHTRRLALALGKGVAAVRKGAPVRNHDFTLPGWQGVEIGANDLTIIAIPVYAGRVPPLARERLEKLSGNGAPCILLVSYGNRAYDDALQELKVVATNSGFQPVAAAACIARHTIGQRFAEGRPNADDLRQVEDFGRRAAAMLAGPLQPLHVPGNMPEKAAPVFPLPQSVNHNCVLCGHCWEQCPAGAIAAGRPEDVDKTRCICCMRCVAICPEGARVPDGAFLAGIDKKLAPLCAEAKANEFF